VIRTKVLDLSRLADSTKGFGNVCAYEHWCQHATPNPDIGVGCIVGELVAQYEAGHARR
jgi:hypothetical protein